MYQLSDSTSPRSGYFVSAPGVEGMAARKWFLLVDENGKDLTSTTSVDVDVEDVDTFRKAVKKECPSALANVDAVDLTVFANRAEYDAKRNVLLPQSWSPVTAYGNNEENALSVQVTKHAESDSRYFIQPNVQEQVEKAVFVIVEEDGERNGVGMGVFSLDSSGDMRP
ncbi:CRN domain-containing protein-containing protein [Phytophthora infestans T30-4]|uniref:CRN domain-containing protein-containing protein n=1 Tax=Phytophthora infestans (strain T30-4) TaxID=403677 RepID=D0N1Y9_PHYIT|nr:CRN domain-containing protein-containing protein [Phytophthora infestans T30-4]EEY68318.1 CRN domain-containing protein-containing protein [Phytophthora infestans T30-4]|eukprot:XP_002905477.1 CRN domain-containing protein-containing protein [Phytophthora infestans T30-4]